MLLKPFLTETWNQSTLLFPLIPAFPKGCFQHASLKICRIHTFAANTCLWTATNVFHTPPHLTSEEPYNGITFLTDPCCLQLQPSKVFVNVTSIFLSILLLLSFIWLFINLHHFTPWYQQADQSLAAAAFFYASPLPQTQRKLHPNIWQQKPLLHLRMFKQISV